MKKRIWICIEKGIKNCSAFAPEVPGCVATGNTVEETRENMLEALALHLEGLLEDGESLDRITGAFPTVAASGGQGGNENKEYYALLEVDLSRIGNSVQA